MSIVICESDILRKNIQTLLKGMPKVVKEIPNVKLLIVGDGPFKAKLEKQVDELGLLEQVIFTGEIPNKDIAPFIKQQTILLVHRILKHKD